MDTSSATGATAPRAAISGQVVPDLRAEVLGTLLIFLFTVAVTAGVALFAHVLVRAVG